PSKHIANPRRLLILTPTSQSLSTIPPLLHSLTGVPVHDPPQHETIPETPASPSDPSSLAAPATTTSFAGYTTHSPLRLATKYYSAEIPLWVDEIPLASTDVVASQWRTEFLSDEAEIVRDAVGALVVCAQKPESSTAPDALDSNIARRPDIRALLDLMRDVGAVKGRIDEERGGVGDVPGVFVLLGSRKAGVSVSTATAPSHRDAESALGVDQEDLGDGAIDVPLSVAWWEEQLFELGLFGWEIIEWDPQDQGSVKTRNMFGELEGMPRIKEVLETHDWSAAGGLQDLDPEADSGFDFDDDLEKELLSFDRSMHTRGFGQEVQELEREMFGLRMAIERGGEFGDNEEVEEDEDEELKVESIEGLMLQNSLQLGTNADTDEDMGAELPENERKKFAAKAVQNIMRDL
ncbi:Alpha/gamma-adaptin-binding protein p34, partial [Penicillium macrosclerotiorum]|uniref:Alpha/gamma-adaptin-binding protein p34 n=1 Tax=Penicillium macrosclerotiorum TaxID=303699 RepID=UPI002548A0C1